MLSKIKIVLHMLRKLREKYEGKVKDMGTLRKDLRPEQTELIKKKQIDKGK